MPHPVALVFHLCAGFFIHIHVLCYVLFEMLIFSYINVLLAFFLFSSFMFYVLCALVTSHLINEKSYFLKGKKIIRNKNPSHPLTVTQVILENII